MRSSMHGVVILVLGCARVGDGAPEPEPESPAEPVQVEREPTPDEAESPEPESPEAEAPAPDPTVGFVPATRGSGTCIVSVVGLLEAQEYRGPGPITPALEASLSADPDFARHWQSHSHGDRHIQCHYLVELAHLPGKRFSWRIVINNLLREYTAETCDGRAAEVADDIVSTTKNCTDLDAGAYWGYVLEPVAQP
jgi:hypothetical protein